MWALEHIMGIITKTWRWIWKYLSELPGQSCRSFSKAVHNLDWWLGREWIEMQVSALHCPCVPSTVDVIHHPIALTPNIYMYRLRGLPWLLPNPYPHHSQMFSSALHCFIGFKFLFLFHFLFSLHFLFMSPVSLLISFSLSWHLSLSAPGLLMSSRF